MASYTDRLILAASRRYGVKPAVLRGLIQVESGGNPRAVSPAGAFGLTQFMPGTARSYGVRRGSSRGAVKSQVLGAAHYLSDLGYKKDRARALASYNGGPGNPQYGYARKVLQTARQYKPLYHRLAAGQGGSSSTGSGTTSVSFPNPKLGGTQLADLLRTQLAQAAPSLPPLGDIPAPAHSAANLVPMPKGPVLQPLSVAEPQVDAQGLAESLRQVGGLKGPKLDQLTVSGGNAGGGAPGRKLVSPDAPHASLGRMERIAKVIDKTEPKYLWGGGHGPRAARFGADVDCSGFVSQVLQVTPRVSGQFKTFGAAGNGKHVTIYAKDDHVLIKINGRFYGTSRSNRGGGAGAIPTPPASYLRTFTRRHPRGL